MNQSMIATSSLVSVEKIYDGLLKVKQYCVELCLQGQQHNCHTGKASVCQYLSL